MFFRWSCNRIFDCIRSVVHGDHVVVASRSCRQRQGRVLREIIRPSAGLALEGLNVQHV